MAFVTARSGGLVVATQSRRRSRESTDEQRAAAVAVLSAHIDELGQAERDRDDDLWNDIANHGVEVVLGGTTWNLSVDGDGWVAYQSADDPEFGSEGSGSADLMGTVGPRSLAPEEIVRRLDTLEFDEFEDND